VEIILSSINILLLLFTALLFVLFGLAAMSFVGVVPLFFEAGCEIAYPVNEVLVGTCLQMASFIVSGIYFLLLLNQFLASCKY